MKKQNTPAIEATEQKDASMTVKQFGTMSALYDYYNEKLFGGELSQCLVNLSRQKGAHGFFSPKRWKVRSEGKKTNLLVEALTGITEEKQIHEISINPDTMHRPDREWQATLAHEMVHLWQEDFGKAPRRCYHDKQFAEKMEEIGLMCSNTGAPGGKKTGPSMTHYIIDGGPFDLAFKAVEGMELPFIPKVFFNTLSTGKSGGDSDEDGGDSEDEKPKLSGKKFKYECECDEPNRVWGKSGLDLQCNSCDKKFTEM